MSHTTNCGCTEIQETTHICGECQETLPCNCEVKDLGAECVLYKGDDIQCQSTNVVLKNTVLSVALKNIVDFFCTKLSEVQNRFRIVNIGTGAKVYKRESLTGQKELRTLIDSELVNIVEGIDDITISVDEEALSAFITDISTADGSETKINAGTNITKSGTGTTADPYVINAVIPPSTFLTNTPVVLASGKTLGKYTNGQTILSAGKTFEEVIKDIALEYVSPVFSSFTIASQPTTVEVGTTLSGSKTFTWGITLNSGIVPTIDIYDNTAAATLLASTPSNDGTQAQTITTIQLNSNNATQSWKGIANNSNGANVNSSNFVVTALFNRFWGAVTTLPASSVDGTANRVYANLLTTAAKTNGTNTFTIVTGTTSNKFIVLLPPSVTITSVVDTGNLNLDITSSYVLSTITIKDAGGTDRTYNQYLFNPAGAYPTTTNHVITTN